MWCEALASRLRRSNGAIGLTSQPQHARLKSACLRIWSRAIVSHSVTRLVTECAKSDASFAEFTDAGKELDRHYIGSRYPDFYAEGAAHDYYTQEMADRCIRYATSILSTVERLLNK